MRPSCFLRRPSQATKSARYVCIPRSLPSSWLRLSSRRMSWRSDMRYKIVETDNFGGDYPDEKFVNVPPTSQQRAERLCVEINATFSGRTAPRYWKVVPE